MTKYGKHIEKENDKIEKMFNTFTHKLFATIKNPESFFRSAEFCYLNDQIEGTIELAKSGLVFDSKSFRGWLILGLGFGKTGMYSEALCALEQAMNNWDCENNKENLVPEANCVISSIAEFSKLIIKEKPYKQNIKREV